MADFNMPPGVSVNDIPGNRPEDVEEEKFWDELDDTLRTNYPKVAAFVDEMWDDYDDELTVLAQVCRDMGYNRGFAEGQDETLMAQSEEK